MKWLDRIIGKEEIPSTVTFDEIDTWLDMVSKSLFRGLSANADQLFGEIKDIRERLKQNISELQDAEPIEDIPAPITKIGLPNRDKMVKHLYSLTEKMLIPTKTDYKTVLSFYSVTASNIEFAFGKSKSSKTIYYVRSLFPDEVKEVISDIDRLKALLNQLIAPIKGKESQIMNLERVPEIVREIKDLKSGIEKEKEQVHEQEEECSVLEKRIEMDGKRLSAIEEKEEWMRFKELEIELASSEEELNALESNIHELFSPINKALNLLKKQDETGRYTLTPEERRALSSILSSPIRALDEGISDFLLSIRNVIEGDDSILKERKRDKTLKWIDHLLNTELSSIKEKREGLQSRIEETKGKLSNLTILTDRKEIERSIISDKEQLAQLQERIDRSKRHIVSLQEKVTEKERFLLEVLEGITGKKIDVKFDFSFC
jgi:hypothetical protein